MRNELLALFLCVSLAAPSLAHADPSAEDVANAKALVKEGRELREKGKYKEALVKFEAAWAYVQTPLTGRDLAQEYERDGRLVEARNVWGEVAKMSPKPGDTKEHADARALAAKKVDELDQRIPTVILKVSAPSEAKVTLDGKDVPAATLGTSRRTNPGPHTLSASAGGAPVSTTFTLKEGEKDRVVTLTVEAVSAAPVAAATTSTPAATPEGPPAPAKYDGPPAGKPVDVPGEASSSSGLVTGGAIVTVLGGLGLVGGIGFLGYGLSERMKDPDAGKTPVWIGVGSISGGAVAFTVGLIMIGVGSSKTHAANRLTIAASPSSVTVLGSF